MIGCIVSSADSACRPVWSRQFISLRFLDNRIAWHIIYAISAKMESINMDAFTGMRVFAEAVEAGNFSVAARRHGQAPSTISRQIGALEKQLGVRLLNRTTRKLSLTEAGQVYRDSVERILSDIDDAHRDMILALCPEGMDIHYLVTTDESLQNALKKYTKWLDDQF